MKCIFCARPRVLREGSRTQSKLGGQQEWVGARAGGAVSVAAFVALCLPYNLHKLQFREIKEKHKRFEQNKKKHEKRTNSEKYKNYFIILFALCAALRFFERAFWICARFMEIILC